MDVVGYCEALIMSGESAYVLMYLCCLLVVVIEVLVFVAYRYWQGKRANAKFKC